MSSIMAFFQDIASSGLIIEREIRSISLPRRELAGKFNETVQAIQKLIDQRMQEAKFFRECPGR